MPFTPFHFGPALLIKCMARRRFSFRTFAATQVAIDIETLFWLLRGEWPVHRLAHTFLGSAIVGLVVAVTMFAIIRPIIQRLWGHDHVLAAEVRASPAFAGGLVGGLSHPLLDGIMHADIMPFRPFTFDNPLLHVLDVGLLHVACFASGVLGMVLLIASQVWKRAG